MQQGTHEMIHLPLQTCLLIQKKNKKEKKTKKKNRYASPRESELITIEMRDVFVAGNAEPPLCSMPPQLPSHHCSPVPQLLRSRRSCSLLGRDLGFHLPSRGEDHLVPPLLQQRLPLVLAIAPRLLAGSVPRCRIATFLVLLLLLDLVFQVVPLDQVRLRRLLCRFPGGRLRCRRGGSVGPRRRRRLEGDGWLGETKTKMSDV
jgi:hypothetical protein